MKTVVITGAGGFIGGALARHFLQKGVRVYGVDVSAKKLEALACIGDFIPVEADFTQYGKLHEMIPSDGIDVFYHFAWQGVFGTAFRDYALQLDNAKYACVALEQAVKTGCRKFVFAGTMNEYEMDAFIGRDYFEPRWTYIYSTVKQAAEAICKTVAFNSGIEYCAGRIAMAYGENNRSMMVPNVVMKNLLDNKPCRLVPGNNPYDMVYIDDIAGAFEAIGERGRHMKSYYIGHREQRTFKDIIQEIADILNSDCELLFGAYPDAPSGVDYADIDTEALYNDTGFECTADFRESIIKTAGWIKTHEEQLEH